MTSVSIMAMKRFRYAKYRQYPSSCSMYSVEYRWMRKPIPVMTRSSAPESRSTRKP